MNGSVGRSLVVARFSTLFLRAEQLMEHAKEEEGRWPLTNENAPVTLAHQEEGC